MTYPAPPTSRLLAVKALLSRVSEMIQEKPFQPHPLLSNAHAQTLGAYAWPRRSSLRTKPDDERLFEVAPGVNVLAHCRWQAERRQHPTLLVWHGIEGSTSSVYMQAMAKKGFAAGFNVIRINLRNCGGTEHLTPTLYHGGQSEDLRAVVNELVERDGLKRLLLVGFSLGGNLVLKLAGEYGEKPPSEVIGISVVSPSVDLNASTVSISRRANWLYHVDFLRRLRRRIKVKQRLYPGLYDVSELHRVKSIRDFDDRYTAVAHGFKDAKDYYTRASSVSLLERIRIPTLIIHAEDDPFIPFAPLKTSAAITNPFILLVRTERGGHVAFLAARPRKANNSSNLKRPLVNETANNREHGGEDRFWAENRVIDFCRLVNES
jgi:predicted alpha/beta-fold hydrolase